MTEEYVVPAPRTPERLLELSDRLKVVVERLKLFPVGAPKEADLANECIRLGILARGLAREWKRERSRTMSDPGSNLKKRAAELAGGGKLFAHVAVSEFGGPLESELGHDARDLDTDSCFDLLDKAFNILSAQMHMEMLTDADREDAIKQAKKFIEAMESK